MTADAARHVAAQDHASVPLLFIGAATGDAMRCVRVPMRFSEALQASRRLRPAGALKPLREYFNLNSVSTANLIRRERWLLSRTLRGSIPDALVQPCGHEHRRAARRHVPMHVRQPRARTYHSFSHFVRLGGVCGVAALTCAQTKGTQSFGKRNRKSHVLCVRCNRRSFHLQKSTCASCGYPSPKTRGCLFLAVACCQKQFNDCARRWDDCR